MQTVLRAKRNTIKYRRFTDYDDPSKFCRREYQGCKTRGNDVYLQNELRDTTSNWFYWAFCVEGAAGETITFHFGENRVGYWGAAVSHDLKTWKWLNERDGESFRYTFGEKENKVYFAHNMLYHPDRFLAFCQKNGVQVTEFCKSEKGRSVPCVTVGNGEKKIVLTARHHACEATGDYVLEGVLEELVARPMPNTTVFCVPFMDYDGVVDGDQGKDRAPHDHNRDYIDEPIYQTTKKLQEYVKDGCLYAFDFHSPWHLGGRNDVEFIVQNSVERVPRFNAFGEIFERETAGLAFRHFHKNDLPFMEGWNQPSANCGAYMSRRKGNELAFSLETPYFGTEDNKVSQENLKELGKAFAKALKGYEAKRG